jgi:hypothetical protein
MSTVKMPTNLQQWVNEEIYRQFTPQISRTAKPPSNDVSVDYNIEFRWPRTFHIVWPNGDIEELDVVAHLHVRDAYHTDGQLPAGPRLGGIWVEGITGSGQNLDQMDGRNNFRDWMLKYVE